MSKAQVHFIVLNYNGYHDTVECLESLKKLSYPNFRVIVVDNASVGGEGERLANSFPEFIHLANKTNLGFSGGNNVGIEKALLDPECRYIFFLNNDTVIDPDALNQLLEIAEADDCQNYGSFQPLMINYYQRSLVDSAGLEYSHNSLGYNRGTGRKVVEFSESTEIIGCCGGAFLCRRAAVEKLQAQSGGFFAQDFFAYCEDLDASLRLQAAGWSALYVPKALVYHKGGQTAKNFSQKRIFWYNRNSLLVLLRNWPLRAIWANVVWLILGQLGIEKFGHKTLYAYLES